MHGEEGGEVNASTPVIEGLFENISATVMGRNMFGGGSGPGGKGPVEQIRAIEAPGVTHLTYRVHRRSVR
jgi:hypothetical protein